MFPIGGMAGGDQEYPYLGCGWGQGSREVLGKVVGWLA